MMNNRYLMSDNLLIKSSKEMYRFGMFDGYWKWLDNYIHNGQIIVLECVYENLITNNKRLKNSDKLKLNKWARKNLPNYLYDQTDDESIKNDFHSIMDYVMSFNKVYEQKSIDNFASSTGPYLISVAKEHGLTIVTGGGSDLFYHGELIHTGKRNRLTDDEIKFYDVASHFNVPCINLYDLEKKLDLQLN